MSTKTDTRLTELRGILHAASDERGNIHRSALFGALLGHVSCFNGRPTPEQVAKINDLIRELPSVNRCSQCGVLRESQRKAIDDCRWLMAMCEEWATEDIE